MNSEVNRAIQNRDSAEKTSSGQVTVFHEILHADLPDNEKTPERLGDEGIVLIGAGGETVAWSREPPPTVCGIMTNAIQRSQ